MASTYLIFKIVHIVGFVAWFAGLFYLVRMFVYHTEAYDEDQPKQNILRKQFELMEKRVYGIICTPAMLITWIFGLAMIFFNGWEWFKVNYWLHAKLALILAMSGYQGYCKVLMKRLEHDQTSFSSMHFRLFNEIPTVLLITIASIAVFKNNTNPLILISSLLGVIILLVAITKLYKKLRSNKRSYD